jgi:cyclic pyranopterin phosphate synthase
MVFTPPAHLLQAPEIIAMAKQFILLGVDKIRLTGGEPLMRKEVDWIARELGQLGVQTTLTTNAALLHRHIDALWDAGMRSLNISLDTLHPLTFLALTKRNEFDTVYNNIQLALERGFKIKINVVVMRGVNHQEINRFVAWTQNTPIEIRFIEFMPFDRNQWKEKQVFTYAEILETIQAQFPIQAVEKEHQATARVFDIAGHQGRVAVISTMTHPFCSDCNRLRLTADGKLKNCLFSKNETDLLTAFRAGQAIEPLIKEALQLKEAALGGQFSTNYQAIHPDELQNRPMIAIGG